MTETRLLAWLDDEQGVGVVAGYTSSDALGRPPVSRTFLSRAAAQQWVEDEAYLLGVEVEWLEGG